MKLKNSAKFKNFVLTLESPKWQTKSSQACIGQNWYRGLETWPWKVQRTLSWNCCLILEWLDWQNWWTCCLARGVGFRLLKNKAICYWSICPWTPSSTTGQGNSANKTGKYILSNNCSSIHCWFCNSNYHILIACLILDLWSRPALHVNGITTFQNNDNCLLESYL